MAVPKDRSVKVVLTAIIGNAAVTVAKSIGWIFSMSPSMLAEAIHSFADTANQTLLLCLIADLSGSKPPLKPGRGVAFNVFYSADKAVKPAAVKVKPVMLAPANILEFNVLEPDGIGSVVPTFTMAPAETKKEKPAAEETADG